eukprot:CAMPEP_0180142016 /NCGR_PEP_ID=MMETSP0986-20121125/15315_1 /TAXON_ID=697907 /ORGANISM="non described non described, Strain CCMP2293" /LENGTH=178 /DNA_ID=CAMNT_0022085105 /DNA_START=15 /DNA_END=551 /DNA_ORIENTATION=+
MSGGTVARVSLALSVIVLLSSSVHALPVRHSASDAVSADGLPVRVIANEAVPHGALHAMGASAKNATTHYEDPYTADCQEGEVNITIMGVPGAMCSPQCGLMDSCPKDKPLDVEAKPACALQDMAGRKFCALICAPKVQVPGKKPVDDVQCGPGASCKDISNVGICTYDIAEDTLPSA